MKKILLFSFAATALFWIGCSQPTNVDSMLKNAESKDQVFAAILEDHELMTEFMNKMMSNEHAVMMMKGNQQMMDMMAAEGNMMQMMKDRPEMMQQMMSGMMKDGNMMGHMMQMMQQEGMMSEECMQSCMQMMKDKGMSMDMQMMEGQGTGKDPSGDAHEDGHH